MISFSILLKLQTNENETNEHIALNFKTLKNDRSESSGDILLDNSCDPDLHVFNTTIQNLDTPYILPEEFQNFLDDDISESLSILHLNIRSIKEIENHRIKSGKSSSAIIKTTDFGKRFKEERNYLQMMFLQLMQKEYLC